MNRAGPRADPDPARGGSARRAWALAALVTLFGLNLRATLGSIPPLLGEIAADLGLGSSALGLLLSTCILAMGAFAPTGHLLATRVGTERALTLLLAILGVSEVVRVAAYHPVVLYASVALAGATMGAASTLMPGFIAHHVPRTRGLTMGIYSTGLALGVALAAATAVPLERLLGGWRPALAVVGLLSLATAVLSWASEGTLVRSMPGHSVDPPRTRDPAALAQCSGSLAHPAQRTRDGHWLQRIGLGGTVLRRPRDVGPGRGRHGGALSGRPTRGDAGSAGHHRCHDRPSAVGGRNVAGDPRRHGHARGGADGSAAAGSRALRAGGGRHGHVAVGVERRPHRLAVGVGVPQCDDDARRLCRRRGRAVPARGGAGRDRQPGTGLSRRVRGWSSSAW
ncbi:MAG: MFS transporter [Actinomycetales bacterium]|uniref:MFS transporter n=1 Tax=Candidatus Phosphoribacter hodrii TaxID=2953743 RepID=A0A9D7TCT3_9MICO|nr:MFS transporter [Candidatus Phosphoribacter hodrii]